MKIKTKKQLNLPQLIEWAMENDVTDRMFLTENSYCVGFDRHGFIYFNSSRTMPLYQTFTVEVEEEITEDTEFEKLYYTTILSRIVESSCTTIQSSLKHIAVEPIAFYIMNDDLTLTLIWRDGKLVE